jgi:hypothetical protein
VFVPEFRKLDTELTEMATSVCFLQPEKGKGKLRLFSSNGNGKWKFVFLGQQTINGNRRLLFQQMCPSRVL